MNEFAILYDELFGKGGIEKPCKTCGMETFDCQDINTDYCETCIYDCLDWVLEKEEENHNSGYVIYDLEKERLGLLIDLGEWVIFMENEEGRVEPAGYPSCGVNNFNIERFLMNEKHLFLGNLNEDEEVVEEYGGLTPEENLANV